MSKKLELLNKRFDRLTVIKEKGKNKQGGIMWLCVCDCGNETAVTGACLKNGHTKSCGCLRDEKTTRRNRNRALKLKGKRFGRLLVIKRASKFKHNKCVWECICDCGNIIIVRGSALKRGQKSCGCYTKEAISKGSKKDLIGQKFNRLLVLKEVGRDKYGSVLWLCKCACGNECIVIGSSLISSNTRSCGCLNKERVIEAKSGKNNSNWKGGVTPQNELIRKLPKYNNWRSKVFKRDNYICQLCGKKSEADIQAHHIYLFATHQSFRFELWNGITLCKKCHSKIRKKEHRFINQFLNITLEKSEGA